jgi:FecR protein
MTRRSVSLPGTLLLCFWTLPAFAQESAPTGQPATDPPAHISVVDGTALLERDGRTDTELLSMPLLAGDRVRTQAGRVEVLFADGSALHLDEQTMVDFQSDEVVRLLGGRVRLSVSRPARDIAYRIDAPSAWVQINNPGEYRVSVLRGDEVELAVLRGGAELVNEQGRSYVSAGERTYARLQAAPSPPYVFNSAAWDSFDRWSESRRDQRLGVSAQYLPEDVRRYAPAFDTYGSWRHEAAYGYVWYPRVQVGWRPYYRGRWASLRPYGWTWIANDPWGWPTHHYGRWGISAGSWFWIPGRSWAPAWVSWGYAPGYVSWCPLGWNNRPVLGFSANYYGGRRYDPWYAWSVLPRGHFRSPYVHVSRYQTVRVDPRLHGSFVVNHRGPDVHFAVNRSGVPIHTAGRSSAWRGEGYRATGDSGGARVSAAPAGTRDVERRFPAGARAPGSPVNNAPPDRAAIRSRDDGRSLSREGTGRSGNADAPPVTTDSSRARLRADVTPGAPDGSARGFRRGDGSEPRTVTEAPAGAVRAVPRVRGADGGSNGAPPQQLRSYSTAPREAPAATAPPAPPQRYREPDAGYRSPQNRAIMRGSDERSAPREPGPRAGVERNGGSYEPRSFGGGTERQAPAPAPRSFGGGERQAPSAAPRSAPSAPRGDGDGGPRGGSGRARSGDGGGTGQAVGRRR